MDFICYLYPGWEPMIRPAKVTREWMDQTPEAFAYRCLPLSIANAHGWEILCPNDTTACWTGGSRVEDVIVRNGLTSGGGPVSLFGQGVLSFHVEGLFRTPPGWDLWIGGPPNQPKSGISPLTGIVEADWSPYTFTMNWKFTRRNHWVRFAKHEPICFVFPMQRQALELMTPKFVRLAAGDDLFEQFRSWSEERREFQAEMANGQPRKPAEKWQKRYYRGITMRNDAQASGHRTKVRIRPFVISEASPLPEPDARDEVWLTKLFVDVISAVSRDNSLESVKRVLLQAGFPEVVANRFAATINATYRVDGDDTTCR